MIWSPILALALLLLDGKPVPPCGDWKALEEDAIEKGYLSGPLEEVASLYAKAAKAAECLQEPPEEIDRLWLRYADWLSLDHPGQAVAFAERRLKEIRNKYGDRHPRETRYLWFEGYYLRHPRVDVPRAERALLRALRIQREANGDESIEAAMALRRMASFYAETDKPEEALRTIDQAIRLAEKAGRAGRGELYHDLSLKAIFLDGLKRDLDVRDRLNNRSKELWDELKAEGWSSNEPLW